MTDQSTCKTPQSVITAEANHIAKRHPDQREAFSDSVQSRYPSSVWQRIRQKADAMMKRRNVS